MMAGVEEVEVVVAHHERATLRVGGVFLKIDADQARADVEVEAMARGAGPDCGGAVAQAAGTPAPVRRSRNCRSAATRKVTGSPSSADSR